MSNTWEVANSCRVSSNGITEIISTVDQYYEYKVLRRMIKTDRDVFIEAGVSITGDENIAHALGELYDAGARLK